MDNKKFEYDYFHKETHSNYRGYHYRDVYPAFNSYAHILVGMLNPKKMLDIGCAKGYLVLAFHRLKVDAYGVDISRYAITHGHPAIKSKIRVHNIETKKLPYPDGYFDLVTSCEVIEHVVKHKLVFKEIKRVLSPNGIVFLTTPVKNILNKDGVPADKTHVSVFPRKKWLKMFDQISLKSISGLRYLKLSLNLTNTMYQNPAKSNLGQFLEKLGVIGRKLRFLILFYDVFFHYQTDVFLLKKS
ncbi:MAG: methyltransferase domain-containing protein [Candidatus Shapirobacteria bacterium]